MRLISIALAIALATAVMVPSLGVAQERALNENRVNRVALLIGNSKYRQETGRPEDKPFQPLNNPCSDVENIAAVLEAAGWDPEREIIMVCDADSDGIRHAISQFKDAYFESRQSLGFVFYAGHGIQLWNETYLLGVDASVNPDKLRRNIESYGGGSIIHGGVRLYADLISQVGDSGSGSIFIVVDACRESVIDQYVRNNGVLRLPYANSGRQYHRGVGGVRLLFSTAYGELASDGVGSSPFAQAFRQNLALEGQIDSLVNRVVNAVTRDTMMAKNPQVPDAVGALNPPPPNPCLTSCGDKK